MTDLRTLNKKKLLEHLDTEIVTLLEIARLTLESWPMRTQIEIKSKMTEVRLEGLLNLINCAAESSAAGEKLERAPVYSNSFHDDITPPNFVAE